MTKKQIVIDYILNNINKGTWKPGRRILSEEDIAKYTNVSRNTVREATITLNSQGILERRHGSGTFVVENNNKRKYVIILYSNFFFKYIIGTTYIYIIEKIKEKLESINQIPLLIEWGKENECLNIEANQISAVIKMTQDPSCLDQICIDNNIPIIEFGNDDTEFSSVKEDTLLQFSLLDELIQKYNFTDLLIFSKNYLDKTHIATSIFLLYNLYFQSKGYNIFLINNLSDLRDAEDVIKKGLNSLKKIPDAIVFLDDNIYKKGYEIYPLFDNLLKKTKLIVFSNGNENYNPQYKTCKIAIDLDEIVEAIFNLTKANINKEFQTKKNIIIKPKIIDEQILV